ncbi:MAG: hypothetical protein ACR2J3_10460 [Aridibacter sp.]
MQRTILLFSIVALVVLFSGFQINNVQKQECECQFIEESLKEISKIKTGMTRKDLLENFNEDGGISAIRQGRFVYKKCSYIKIDITFELAKDKQNKLTRTIDDEILNISKPYLEHPYYD